MSERSVPRVVKKFHVSATQEGITMSSDQLLEVLLHCKMDNRKVAQSL